MACHLSLSARSRREDSYVKSPAYSARIESACSLNFVPFPWCNPSFIIITQSIPISLDIHRFSTALFTFRIDLCSDRRSLLFWFTLRCFHVSFFGLWACVCVAVLCSAFVLLSLVFRFVYFSPDLTFHKVPCRQPRTHELRHRSYIASCLCLAAGRKGNVKRVASRKRNVSWTE